MSKFIPPFYSKLDKSASDLLKADDYDLSRKISLKTVSQAGPVFTSSLTAPDAGSAVGNLKAEYKNKALGEISGEVDTVQLISGTWKTPELFTKGLKFEIKAKHDKKADKKAAKPVDAGADWKAPLKTDCFVSVEDQYTRDNLSATALFKVANAKSSDKALDYGFSGSAVFGSDGIAVGVEGELDAGKLTKRDVAFGFLKKDVTLVAKSTDLLQKYSLSYYQSVLPKVNVAAIGSYDVKKGSKGFKFGLAHEIDESSSVRAAISTDSDSTTVSGLYTALINKNSKISLSSIIDVKNFAAGSHKFGVKFELGDL